MVCRPATGESGITLKYSGSSYNTDGGVVIYFTKNCKLMTYNNKNEITKTVEYEQGYYYINLDVKVEVENGEKIIHNIPVDLFSENTRKSAKKITTDSAEYKRVSSIDMYSSMVDTNGKLKDIHSAYEGEYEKGKEKVDILNDNGEFTSVANSNSFSNTPRKVFTKGWQDYYIYCAPSEMPTAGGYYDMYSGKEFNYLWYNIKPMKINASAHMSIRSRIITLSIGPNENETVYYNQKFDPKSYNQTNLPTNVATDSDTVKFTARDSGKTAQANGNEYKGVDSNKIIQKNSSASFSVKPYWNEDSFTLKVVNDFIVQMYDGTTYTIKADDYTDIPEYIEKNTENNPEDGLDLFSDIAKKYFESHSTSRVDSESSSIKWVEDNAINTLVNSSNLDQSSSVIKFKATCGGTLKDGTYKGKAIYCDFGNGSSGEDAIKTYGNNATLKADVVSIGADLLERKDGKGLKINTYSAHDESTCVVDGNPIDGSMLQITRKTTLKFNDTDADSITLSPGYYFFPNINDDFDILSKAFWDKWNSSNPYYKAEKLSDGTVAYKKVIVSTKMDPVDFEGKYF